MSNKCAGGYEIQPRKPCPVCGSRSNEQCGRAAAPPSPAPMGGEEMLENLVFTIDHFEPPFIAELKGERETWIADNMRYLILCRVRDYIAALPLPAVPPAAERPRPFIEQMADEDLADAAEAQVKTLTKPFRYADEGDWNYLIGLLENSKRHGQDAQTGFWITTMKEVRAALATKEPT